MDQDLVVIYYSVYLFSTSCLALSLAVIETVCILPLKSALASAQSMVRIHSTGPYAVKFLVYPNVFCAPPHPRTLLGCAAAWAVPHKTSQFLLWAWRIWSTWIAISIAAVKRLKIIHLTSLCTVIAQGSTNFDWNSIEASTNLSWVECFSGFQCARFKAPLDYSNPDNEQSAAIAVVKLPAQGSASEYGGPIFINPGGPGGSGVIYALTSGEFLQSTFGSQFDIIGFDPRGVNNTIPKVSIFNSDEEQMNWLSQEPLDFNSTEEALPEAWARYKAFSQLAESRDNNTLNHVTTGDVARDILGIGRSNGTREGTILWKIVWNCLGGRFCFHVSVGRVVIDGCADMDGWFNLDLASLIEDADKTMQAFFDGCYSAGPENCAFYASSPAEIEANLNDIYDSLRSQPMPVFSGDTYGVLTYDQLRSLIFGVLYFPTNFPFLAQGLAELQAGNATSFYQAFLAGVASEDAAVEAPVAIHCSDAEPLNLTATDMREYMGNINSTFAGMGALPVFMNRCTMEISPRTSLQRQALSTLSLLLTQYLSGPVGAKNTSFPLLIIGNTADPITPLAAAKKTSSVFPGSVLLTLDSPGHTSAFVPSNCTQQYIGAYFSNGTLPEEGIVCSLDGGLAGLFPSINDTQSK
ncbi:hypothetical protein D9758_007284 [Tetrapyrgos nigripes]|uniref:Peptidase S33 tripeptidyl aminopeptidase-like C-terminal domain-containing protein n=1 Tax=Tetrapyrgos nigripes TaxID=182062 RepID=A0A8H5LLK2_9AGAR|nr:hypothetical protein D9758_007284 [Tetrapyrgos nigripes]